MHNELNLWMSLSNVNSLLTMLSQ